MIDALHELKNNIARVERSHPHLGNDLSSTCDRAILALQETRCRQHGDEVQDTFKTASQPINANPLSQIVDKTGACIITVLDRMGDGIIFIFAKIASVFS